MITQNTVTSYPYNISWTTSTTSTSTSYKLNPYESWTTSGKYDSWIMLKEILKKREEVKESELLDLLKDDV